MENKKKLIAGIVGGIVGLALIGAVAYLYINLDNQRKENKAMQELAELDKKEMENEYQQFANQYSEMRMQISNDSIIAQLTAEQEKTEKLLKELKETKTNDAREIARLKKELATVRAILRNYVIEIDSLNRLNHNLTEENSRIKGQYNEATRQIEGLNTECKSVQVNFSIAKNVTAANGTKTFYVRITTPSGTVLSGGGSFAYQNRQLEATMKKTIEYDGQEKSLTLYWNVSQSLMEGTYQVSIFADGNMIGSRSFSFK